MTWLALLGGMLAIPYYFLSDEPDVPISRKDYVAAPLPSLSPPAFNGVPHQNEIGNKRRQKRPRRPQHLNGPRRHQKPPAGGVGPKIPQDKVVIRNWQNSELYKQLQQQSQGLLPPPGNSKVTFLPPINAVHSPHAFGPHLQPGSLAVNPDASNQASVPQENIIPPHAVPGSHITGTGISESLVAPPFIPENNVQQVSIQERNKQTEAILFEPELQESILSPQISVPDEELVEKPGVTERKQDDVHHGHFPPKPNSILQSVHKDADDSQHKPVLPGKVPPGLTILPPPPTPTFIQHHAPPAVLHPESNQIISAPGQPLNSGAPFIPTHHLNGSTFVQRPGIVPGEAPRPFQGPSFSGHQVRKFPVIPNQVHPHKGLGFRVPPIPGQPPLAPFFRAPITQTGQHVPFQNRPALQGGVRGVPYGIDQSLLVSPLLPPPPPVDQLGSGEERDTFGSIRPLRLGNSHFKVSHEDKKYRVASGIASGEVEKTVAEKDADLSVSDSVHGESVISPTIVYASPHSNMPSQVLTKEQKNHPIATQQQPHYSNQINIRPEPVQNRPVHRPLRQEQPQLRNQFHEDHDGFIPIYGPPKTPHGLLNAQENKMAKVPKPKDFLDKLIAENKEKKKSTVEIQHGRPFSIVDETGIYPPNRPGKH